MARFGIWWLLSLGAGGYLLYLLSPILTPFLAGAILAYVLDPVVERLVRWRLPRTAATVLTLVAVLLCGVVLVLVTVPLVDKEVQLFMQRLPAYVEWLRNTLEPRANSWGVSLDIAAIGQMASEHLSSAGSLLARALPSLKSGGMALMGVLMNLVLIPVVFFYLLRDWPLVVGHVKNAVPRPWFGRVSRLATQMDQVLGEFLRGQLSVMLLMAVYYAVALLIAGLDVAVPVGIIAGLIGFIPYLGAIVGLLLATVAAVLQFQDFSGVMIVWLIFGGGHALEGMVVTPLLVGDRIGLHPVAVIFSLMAFGQLFGFFGVLLALPISAALLVALRALRDDYLSSSLYRGPVPESSSPDSDA